MKCVLEVNHITKKFPGVIALKDVSMSVNEGEIMGLIGENGAGKSTLLKIVNGLYPYGTYEGTISIMGQDQKFSCPNDAHNKGVGFVPQEIDVLDNLTVGENIFVGNLAKKHQFVSIPKVCQQSAAFLGSIHIDIDPKTKVRLLSVGQKQLLMIARALSRDPKVLILDEPTAALTNRDVDNLFRIIENLKKNGKSIIFVTHKLDEIMHLTDKVTVLRDGQKISVYNKSEFNEKKIISDMIGREITNIFPSRTTKVSNDVVLELKNIYVEHLKIENKLLLSNISFQLKKGELLGVAGLVGSGRTELLKTIYGGYIVQSGQVFIQGSPVCIKSHKTALEHGISMISEDRKFDGLLMRHNIRKNITISNLDSLCRLGVVNQRRERKVASDLKEKLAIKTPSIENGIISLSGGNQQKVIIARAMNCAPSILLMDEPTKGVDVGAKYEIYKLTNSLIEKGISIIMVSSELPELIGMCDRILVMAGGKIVGEVEGNDISQENVMGLAIQSRNKD